MVAPGKEEIVMSVVGIVMVSAVVLYMVMQIGDLTA
jgi:hypothetical protein